MSAIYDADNSSNWEQIYSGSFAATYPQGQQIPVYTPIPRTLLPVNIDSSLLAIYAQSTDYPNTQKYLGRVIQSIVSNGTFPTATANSKGAGLWSNETTLIEFTEYDDNYQLLLVPKFYIEQITLTVFKYIGSANYEVENRLNIIEGKIDQLL